MALPTSSVEVDFSNTTMDADQQNYSTCPATDTDWMIYAVVPVYVLIISVLGIVLNILVLLMFWIRNKAWTVPDIYLFNMAAADLLLTSFLPFWAVNVSNKFIWAFGSHLCRIVNVSIVMNSNCSIYFLVLVTIDRFLALVHPLTSDRVCKLTYTKLSCLLVWCFGFLLSVPTLMYRKVKHYPARNATFCTFSCSEAEYITTESLMTVFSFIIPVAILSYCTVKIVPALQKPFEGVKMKKMEQKATILVLVVLVAFLICWVPFHIIRIIELLLRTEIIPGNDSCEVVRIFRICTQIFVYFAFFNSVLNPIIYITIGRNVIQSKILDRQS